MTKDKPLIEEVVEWINPWGDKESAIPTRKVAEAVKKLKEDILFRKEFAQNEDEDIVLRDLLIDIDKIMGNFNNSPQDGFTREEEQPEISHPKEKLSMKNSRCEGNVANSTSEDTHVKKDKGCGRFFSIELVEGVKEDAVCGVDGLCPKCEVGLKEDKQ